VDPQKSLSCQAKQVIPALRLKTEVATTGGDTGSGTKNIALGKPTSQSSTDWGGESYLAVDGNTGVNWYMAHHPEYQDFIFSRYRIAASGRADNRAHWALIDVGNDNNRQNDVLVVNVHYVTDSQGINTAKFVSDVIAGKNSQIPRDVTILAVGDFNNTPTGILILPQSVLDAHKLQRMDVALNPAQALVDGEKVNVDHLPLFVDLRPTR
jgi:hypothetical protein